MKRRRLSIAILLLAALACVAPAVRAQDGLQGALSRNSAAQPFRACYGSLFEQRLVAADFDGDRQPDGALLLPAFLDGSRTSYRVEVHLSNSNNTELSFESTDRALSVAALDINHDGLTDLVVEQALTHHRLQVWLGDGRGGFRKARVEEFPQNDRNPGNRASTPNWEPKSTAVGLLPEQRFGAGMLRSSHVSGRPPSPESFCPSTAISSRSLLLVARLGLRGPPFLQST